MLLYAQVVHILGDAAVAAGLATTLFFDVPVGEARTEVGLYLLLAFAPYAVLAPLVAPVIARRSRAHGGVVVGSDAVRAVFAVLLIGRLDSALLYPLGFGILVLSRTHAVSKGALVPALVEDEDLLDANASISFVSGIAGVVGGAVGLTLSAVAGPPAALLLAASVFAAGTLTGLWLHPPSKEAPEIRDKGWLTGTESIRITGAVFSARICLGFTAMLVAFSFHGTEDRLSLVVAGVALAVATWLPSVVVPALRTSVSRLQLAAGSLAILVVVAAAASPIGAPAERGPGYARYETLLQLGWVVGAAPATLIGLPLTAGAVTVALVGALGLVTVAAVPRIAGRPAR